MLTFSTLSLRVVITCRTVIGISYQLLGTHGATVHVLLLLDFVPSYITVLAIIQTYLPLSKFLLSTIT